MISIWIIFSRSLKHFPQLTEITGWSSEKLVYENQQYQIRYCIYLILEVCESFFYVFPAQIYISVVDMTTKILHPNTVLKVV